MIARDAVCPQFAASVDAVFHRLSGPFHPGLQVRIGVIPESEEAGIEVGRLRAIALSLDAGRVRKT
jgi:hypothetical protein